MPLTCASRPVERVARSRRENESAVVVEIFLTRTNHLVVYRITYAPFDHACAVFGRSTGLRGLVRTDFAIGVAESSLSVVLIGGFRAKMQRAQPAETRVGNYFAAWTSWASNQCSQTEGRRQAELASVTH